MKKRIIAALLAAALLAGCTPAVPITESTGGETTVITTAPMDESVPATTETLPQEETTPTVPATVPTEPTEPPISVEQRNSINMLNYLVALVTEINASSGSRVFLDSVYMDLQNNTDPSMVDPVTLKQYNDILDTLEEYRMIDVKRERLNYIYEQNRADAIRAAVPNPMNVLNVVQSGNALKALVSGLFLVVDSVESYKSHTAELDQKYLQDNWNLEDQEAKNLHNSRKGMFNYLVTVTDQYNLPGLVTLNEDYTTEFVEWKNNDNFDRRIHWLEDRVGTYRYFGDYWLALAESYYLNGENQKDGYQKCLEAIAEYESLEIAIYRKDYKYAEVLPYVILSAREVMDMEQYTAFASVYLKRLEEHANQYDWAKQYFACQMYMDLYAVTEDRRYLEEAYDIAYDAATTYLAEEQERLNTEYLTTLEKQKVDKNASEQNKKKVEEQNEYIEYLTKIRKTELAPVYEPMRMFCDILFGLANELDKDDETKLTVEKELRGYDENGKLKQIFLDRNLDNLYRFNKSGYEIELADVEIDFNGKQIVMPAQYVSAASQIVLSVNGVSISDWDVKAVNRNKTSDIADFVVTFVSEEVRELKFEEGMVVTIEVFPYDGSMESMCFTYDVVRSLLSADFIRR